MLRRSDPFTLTPSKERQYWLATNQLCFRHHATWLRLSFDPYQMHISGTEYAVWCDGHVGLFSTALWTVSS